MKMYQYHGEKEHRHSLLGKLYRALGIRGMVFLALNSAFFFILIISLRDTSDNSLFPITKSDLSPEFKLLRSEIAGLRRQLAGCGKEFETKLHVFPKIYAITPTHTRPVQVAELTRISQTFLLVPRFHWIVIEDSETKTPLVANLLAKSGLSYTHLNAGTPKEWKLKLDDPQWQKPRGVKQRNAGLDWLRQNADPREPAVLYFADDDNTYSLELFEEMRYTSKASVWPVGLAGGLFVEKPLLNTKGKVTGWSTKWRPERPFAIDMAGFAISVPLLLSKPEAQFSFDVPRGYQESAILGAVVTKDDLDVKAKNCTKVLVWHTRTENPKLVQEDKMAKEGKSSMDGMEF